MAEKGGERTEIHCNRDRAYSVHRLVVAHFSHYRKFPRFFRFIIVFLTVHFFVLLAKVRHFPLLPLRLNCSRRGIIKKRVKTVTGLHPAHFSDPTSQSSFSRSSLPLTIALQLPSLFLYSSFLDTPRGTTPQRAQT